MRAYQIPKSETFSNNCLFRECQVYCPYSCLAALHIVEFSFVGVRIYFHYSLDDEVNTNKFRFKKYVIINDMYVLKNIYMLFL